MLSLWPPRQERRDERQETEEREPLSRVFRWRGKQAHTDYWDWMRQARLFTHVHKTEMCGKEGGIWPVMNVFLCAAARRSEQDSFTSENLEWEATCDRWHYTHQTEQRMQTTNTQEVHAERTRGRMCTVREKIINYAELFHIIKI